MTGIVRFDCFEVDLPAGQIRKRGVRINLREKCFQVLASLLEHPGEVVTREQLRRRLWPDDVFVDFDNNLNTAIATLREVLGDSAEHPRFVETLPRRGYRFVATVSDASMSPHESDKPRTRLLVLPLLNLSGDAAEEYFSDATTEELIAELGRIAPARLGVIARTTAFHYKGTRKDIARIGSELGVDFVAEGGVRRTDDYVAITIQLIRTRDQLHVFAERYEGQFREIFGMESSVAQAIAQHLGIVDVETPIDVPVDGQRAAAFRKLRANETPHQIG